MKTYSNPRMHSSEHILSAVMIQAFGCGRPVATHIERKKSKCDYRVARPVREEEMRAVELRVNEMIRQGLPITEEFLSRAEAEERYHLGRLPEDAGERIRIVRVGEEDACPCIGEHAASTSEIGAFRITTWSQEGDVLRIRFRLDEPR